MLMAAGMMLSCFSKKRSPADWTSVASKVAPRSRLVDAMAAG